MLQLLNEIWTTDRWRWFKSRQKCSRLFSSKFSSSTLEQSRDLVNLKKIRQFSQTEAAAAKKKSKKNLDENVWFALAYPTWCSYLVPTFELSHCFECEILSFFLVIISSFRLGSSQWLRKVPSSPYHTIQLTAYNAAKLFMKLHLNLKITKSLLI